MVGECVVSWSFVRAAERTDRTLAVVNPVGECQAFQGQLPPAEVRMEVPGDCASEHASVGADLAAGVAAGGLWVPQPPSRRGTAGVAPGEGEGGGQAPRGETMCRHTRSGPRAQLSAE